MTDPPHETTGATKPAGVWLGWTGPHYEQTVTAVFIAEADAKDAEASRHVDEVIFIRTYLPGERATKINWMTLETRLDPTTGEALPPYIEESSRALWHHPDEADDFHAANPVHTWAYPDITNTYYGTPCVKIEVTGPEGAETTKRFHDLIAATRTRILAGEPVDFDGAEKPASA